MAELFSAYLPSKEKRPLYSVKNTDNWLREPPANGDYVGILKPNIVQVDFDEKSDAEIALKIVDKYKLRCDVLKTSRGYHMYFISDGSIKSQSVGLYDAIGLRSDIGLGIKDRVVPLRITKAIDNVKIVNGEEVITQTMETTQREWIRLNDELDILPPFFRPIGKRNYELQKCDTRNQSLFNYILVLQNHNFNKEETRKTIKIINDFILYEPLTDKEIDTITRDEAFSEELFFSEDGKFMHDRFGNYMLANCNIIKIDNQTYIYTSDNLYSNSSDEFEKIMIRKIPSLKDAQRKEVYKYICLQCEKKGKIADSKYIGLKNSILDIETMSEIPYSPSIVMTNKIDFEYNPSSQNEIMDRTLDKVCCHDTQIRMLLEEMIGYALYRKNSMQVCFILTGGGSNGKSTILNCIKKLLGKSNYTSLDLRELEEQFKPSELYNKLANIGDDISPKYLENSSAFKKCVTGESFMVQKKYGQPFELESYATQIFCANELPQVKDKSDGFSRRIVIVPFNAKFSKHDMDYDPFIESKLLSDESIEYLFALAINGLRRVVTNMKFTKSDKGEHEKQEYIISNNNVLEWLEENSDTIENNSVNDIYLIYCVWCAKNGCQATKKLNFTKEIMKQLGLISKPKNVGGKTIRVYCKESEVAENE